MILTKLIAEWIIHHCDEPVDEVVYILDKAYPSEKLADMNEEYVGVVEYLSSLDSPRYRNAVEHCLKELEEMGAK